MKQRNTFPGIWVNGQFYSVASEAAKAAGVTRQAIHLRVKNGFGKPIGRPVKYRDIRFRGKPYPDAKTAARFEGVSVRTVQNALRKQADGEGGAGTGLIM